MKINDLVTLTAPWGLAVLDTGTRALTLTPVEGGLLASFRGMFSEAERFYKGEHGLEFEVSVSGELLRNVLNVMPEDSAVALSATDSNLIVRAEKARNANLRRVPGDQPPGLLPPSDAQSFTASTTRLIEALQFLRGVIVEGVRKTVLTGIRVGRSKNGVVTLTATDGETRLGVVPVGIRVAEGWGECIPKTADLVVTLPYFDKVTITHDAEHDWIFLHDDTTRIRLSLLNGQFPSFARIPRTFEHEVTLPQSEISAAIKACAYFDSDGLVTFSIAGGSAHFEIQGHETGSFHLDLGAHERADVSMLFDAKWLEPVMAMGAVIRLQYTTPKQPVLFSGEGKSYWLSPSIR